MRCTCIHASTVVYTTYYVVILSTLVQGTVTKSAIHGLLGVNILKLFPNFNYIKYMKAQCWQQSDHGIVFAAMAYV